MIFIMNYLTNETTVAYGSCTSIFPNRNIYRWRNAHIFYDEMSLKMDMSWEMNGILYCH